MTWSCVRSSVRGTAHIADGRGCEDRCVVNVVSIDGTDYLIAVVADGAGSALFGGHGAETACVVAAREMEQTLSRSPGELHVTTVRSWINAVRAQLRLEAESRHCLLRDLACTLLGVAAGPNNTVFFQVGDGAIVAAQSGIRGVIFWPDSGEYANMTHFVTDDDADANLQVCAVPIGFDELAMLSDGLQRLALQFELKTPFEPFFEPMFRRLRSASPEDCEALDGQLYLFLQSAAINERTDDDKTLVLAAVSDHGGV